MTRQAGTGEDVSRPDRRALLKDFRRFLVDEYSTPESMTTVLRDAGLEPTTRYVTNSPEADNRWSEALARIDRESKLIKFIEVVRDDSAVSKDEIEALYEFEKHRDWIERTPAECLRDSLRFAGTYFRQLRDNPEHPTQQSLTALQDQVKDLFRLLDELRANPEPAADRRAGAAQLGDIEKRANMCMDILQYYKTLLNLAAPPDVIQIGSTGSPGDLGDHARDERVLLQAKAALRNALARLAESA